MIPYFGLFPKYIWRVIRHTATFLGIAALILVGLGMALTPLSRYLDIVKVEGVIAILFFAIASYGVFREEHVMRSQRESRLQLIARPSSYSMNMRNPPPDGIDIHAIIKIEVWVEVDCQGRSKSVPAGRRDCVPPGLIFGC